MKDLEITDLVPERAEFSLISKGEKKYFLRPINMADRVWIRAKFGDRVQEIFEKINMIEITKIVFHQLEDKSDFRPITIQREDDDGELREIRLTGSDLLAEAITGVQETLEIYFALLKTLGITQVALKKLGVE